MATPWTVPPLWKGQTVAILASGPSMSASAAAAARRRCQRTIAVNNTGVRSRNSEGIWHDAVAPWADVLYSCDAKWWLANAQEALNFPGLKVCMDDSTPFASVLCVKRGQHVGFDERRDRLASGGNSGYQAVCLAVHLGAARIELYGFDMKPAANGKLHYFGNHPGVLHQLSPYKAWVRNFAELAAELEQRGIEVVNCTPGSALTCFPMATIEACLG